jgi:hypothetical protein
MSEEEAAFNKAFCARTRALRRTARKTPVQIARALGLAPRVYARYETREALPPHLLEPFAKATGSRIDDLYGIAE